MPRPDLRKVGISSNRCGFRFALPARYFDGKQHVLSARVVGAGDVLRSSNQPFRIELVSNIDVFSTNRVAGWIANLHAPASPVRMDVWLDGALLGTFSADLPRDDVAVHLKLAEKSVGAGYDISLPAPEKPGQIRRLRLCPPGRAESLTGPSRSLSPRPWGERRFPRSV